MSDLKFEVGKFYADRKGRKWECVCVDANDAWTIIAVRRFESARDSRVTLLDACGRFYNTEAPYEYDLIAEWVEPKKPREWEVFLMENGTIWGDVTCNSYTALFMYDHPGSKRIKVREVLDDK